MPRHEITPEQEATERREGPPRHPRPPPRLRPGRRGRLAGHRRRRRPHGRPPQRGPAERQHRVPAPDGGVHDGLRSCRRGSTRARRCPTSWWSSATGGLTGADRAAVQGVRRGCAGPTVRRRRQGARALPLAAARCRDPQRGRQGAAHPGRARRRQGRPRSWATPRCSSRVRPPCARRPRSTLAPSGLNGLRHRPRRACSADFVTAFGGIDGILLGVALGVVFLILLIVYRSPILPFAVLLTAVFGLAAAALVIFPLAKSGTIGAQRAEPGDPVHPRGRGRDRLRAAAGGALPRGAARPPEQVGGDAGRVAGRGRADRRQRRHGHPRPALPACCPSWATPAASARSARIGIAGAFVAALTFLPAVLLLFGRSIFWPVVPRVDHVHAEDAVGTRGYGAAWPDWSAGTPAVPGWSRWLALLVLGGVRPDVPRRGHHPVPALPQQGRVGHRARRCSRATSRPGPAARSRSSSPEGTGRAGRGHADQGRGRLRGRRHLRPARRARGAAQGRRRQGPGPGHPAPGRRTARQPRTRSPACAATGHRRHGRAGRRQLGVQPGRPARPASATCA